MEYFDDNDYRNYWETNMFLQTQELDSFFDEGLSSYYDSSSPDGTPSSSLPAKNTASERNRRKKLNERLYALRSVVPNITKMDKASIIKDAIAYIQSLQDEGEKIEAEIAELESGKTPSSSANYGDFEQEATTTFRPNPKRTRREPCYEGSSLMPSSPIEVLELKVSRMGEKVIVVSLTCNRSWDTMVKLCEIFEPLKLRIITSNITAFPGRVSKTVFVEGDEEEIELLRVQIEAAIAAAAAHTSLMSSSQMLQC